MLSWDCPLTWKAYRVGSPLVISSRRLGLVQLVFPCDAAGAPVKGSTACLQVFSAARPSHRLRCSWRRRAWHDEDLLRHSVFQLGDFGCAQEERDCPVLVNTCSEAARGFYLRNGFQEVGGQPTMIGGSTHWWMAFPTQTHQDVPVKS